MFLDIHSHILPNVDDGPSTLNESLALLQLVASQGIDRVIATPHFYAEKTIYDDYISLVNKQYELLLQQTDGLNLPKVLLGFEVRYYPGISRSDKLHELCLAGSNYLLIESRYDTVSEAMVNEIAEIRFTRGVTPILAHIERYHNVKGFHQLLQLVVDGCALAQTNAESILGGPNKHAALRLIAENLISFIASDSHSLDKRPPKIKEAFEIIRKKFGIDVASKLINNSCMIL